MKHRRLTCWSCAHSTAAGGLLVCGPTGQPRPVRCDDFDYEPGTDEAERYASLLTDSERDVIALTGNSHKRIQP